MSKPSPVELETYLTVNDVAAALRTDPVTVYRAIRAGQLEAVRLGGVIGGAIRIPKSSLDAYLVPVVDR